MSGSTKQQKGKTVTFLGMEGNGANRTDAKKDAQEKIEASLSGSYYPTIVNWRGMAAFMWREPSDNCWRYTIDRPEDRVEGVKASYGSNVCGTSLREAKWSMLYHLAQNGWTVEDGKTLPAILSDLPAERQQEFLYWARWQLAAEHAKTVLGITDHNERHRWACENEQQF